MTVAKLTEAMPSKLGQGLVTLKFEGVPYDVETAGSFIEIAKKIGQTFEFEVIDVMLEGKTPVAFITSIDQTMEVKYRETDGVLHLGEFVSQEKITLNVDEVLLFGTHRFTNVTTEVLSITEEHNEKGTHWYNLRMTTETDVTIVAKVFMSSLNKGFNPKTFERCLMNCDIIRNKYGYQVETIHRLIPSEARDNKGHLERELKLASDFIEKEFKDCKLKGASIEQLTTELRDVTEEVQGYPLLWLAYAKMQLNNITNCFHISSDIVEKVTKLLMMYSLGWTSKKKLNASQRDKAVMVCMLRNVATVEEYEALIDSGATTYESELFNMILSQTQRMLNLKVRGIIVE